MINMSRVTGVYTQRLRCSRTNKKAKRDWRRVDWTGMRHQAEKHGIIPRAPAITHDRRPMLNAVVSAAQAGDLDRLQDLQIGCYNSAMKALSKFREICIIALTTRRNR
jgi:hypothetical protein